MSQTPLYEVRVVALREEASGIVSCELRATAGTLPFCPPGAHVDVHLPNALVRQYSVANADAAMYLIAVKREPASRGGSAFVAESLRIGARLRIGAPRDNFPLDPPTGRVVLIAGGIGITAMLPMARHLATQECDWSLHYAVRHRQDVGFSEALRAFGEKVHLHVSSESGGRLALVELVESQPDGTHFYCCGPTSMLDAFLQATASLPPGQVHYERFGADTSALTGEAFVVRLARSGRSVSIASNQSIVEALMDIGIEVPYSCQQGICGACEVKVLAGTPDHRDEVLTESEKTSNASMMICCSRARTPEIVLDL
jgi:vanillate O-demethylase ferredoxin subunit